jgi:hypothetical protein
MFIVVSLIRARAGPDPGNQAKPIRLVWKKKDSGSVGQKTSGLTERAKSRPRVHLSFLRIRQSCDQIASSPQVTIISLLLTSKLTRP